MKNIFFAISAMVVVIACSNISSPDKEAAPLHIETVGINDTTINFENYPEGKAPVGFIQTATGRQQTLDWKIVNDNGNKVTAQVAKNSGNYYNLLILDHFGIENFSVSVRIKAVAGGEDQGGGLLWRCIDKNNYYVARYNPLEKNFRLYRVIDGSRKQLQSVDSDIKSGEWFTMTIQMKGNSIIGLLNGKKLIETTDDTFKSAGLIGFWTKADAVTWFDDLQIISDK